jgi:hypothetical protein
VAKNIQGGGEPTLDFLYDKLILIFFHFKKMHEKRSSKCDVTVLLLAYAMHGHLTILRVRNLGRRDATTTVETMIYFAAPQSLINNSYITGSCFFSSALL